jgi:uncharacterized RDD family membrane protein YckC
MDEGSIRVRPGGFWRRALALGIDLVVVRLLVAVGGLIGMALRPLTLVAEAFWYAYLLVVPAAYFVVSHGTDGQTIGKWLLGARVVAVSGEAIGYGRALARLAAAGISVISGGLGFLLAAVREDRRALHDLIAGTRVVRVR